MSCIFAKDLCFSRGSVKILKDVGISVEPGSLVGLIGHNGAGKSTLIKLILGLLQPASGTLEVFGGKPGSEPLRIGYLPENVSFYNAMTIEEHLEYFGALKNVSRQRREELIEALGLAHVRKNKAGRCSKGQRQRLGLAQAILSRPELLLLDEPTVGLDPDASGFMYQELVNLQKSGCTVLVCTHELALIEPYLTKGIVMGKGRVCGQGALPELRRQARLPVSIETQTDAKVLLKGTQFESQTEGSRVLVSEDGLPEAIRVLTKEIGKFDFLVHRPTLREIYDALVHGSKEGEEAAK